MKDKVAKHVQNLEEHLPHCRNEQATKQLLIVPFIEDILGYSTRTPEVLPEYIADMGNKKGEKIDYAICLAGQPIIFIECKSYGCPLGDHRDQLARYISTRPDVKFAILTDGIIYKFYSDLNKNNVMDVDPFWEIDLTRPEDIDCEVLRHFTKEAFEAQATREAAIRVRYAGLIKMIVEQELHKPTPQFAKFIFEQMKLERQSYRGRVTELVPELLKAAIDHYIGVKSKIAAGNAVKDHIVKQEQAQQIEVCGGDEIVPREDEVAAFNIVKAILCREVPLERLVLSPGKYVCSILLDGARFKAICRLDFKIRKNHVVLLDTETEERVQISGLNEIYQYSERLAATLRKHLTS